MSCWRTPRAAALLTAFTLSAGGLALPSLAFGDATADALLQKTAALRKPTNAVQTMKMEVTDRKGNTKERTLEVKTRVDGQSTYTLAEVLTPEDVAGTKFLSRMLPGAAPELYLYLPRLNRTSKMLAKRAALLGSDFAPAEMDFSIWEGAEHTYIGKETLEIEGKEVEADVVESKATAADADYPRSKVWLGVGDGFPRRVEFMEADGAVVKRWTIYEVATEGGALYPKRSRMETVDKGTYTTLTFVQARFGVPDAELPTEMFTADALGGKKEAEAPKGGDGGE